MAIDNDIGMFNENAGAVYNAVEYRRFFDRMMGWDARAWGGTASSATGNGGVCRHYGSATTGDLAVIQRVAGADMSVDVLLGGCMVCGTLDANQGNYFVFNDATVNVPIDTAHASWNRYDIVGVQIDDTGYGGASDSAAITVIKGTAAASPSEPTLPDNFLPLARVTVEAAVTSIVTAKITDRRRMLSALGGVTVCTSTTRPSVGLWAGQAIYETDTGLVRVCDGTNWVAVHPWYVVAKTADESVTSSTTLQNDDHLFFTATSGASFEFEFSLVYANAAGATPDMKVAAGEDATARGAWNRSGIGTSDTALSSAGHLTDQTDAAGFGTSATKRMAGGVGRHQGAGGTFRILWAQNTSDGTATIVYTGSLLRYRRIV